MARRNGCEEVMLRLEEDEIALQTRSVQTVQLQILLDIDKICRENGRKYYVIGGTLLGAVRHKGFIPWDDDIDIAMQRLDYDWFMENGQGLLTNKYYLQNYRTEKYYYLPFAKVRKKGTTYVEQQLANLNIHHGVYIDIFPLDHVPDSECKRKLQWIEIFCLSKTIMSKMKVITIKSSFKHRRTIAFFLRVLSFSVSKHELGNRLERVMKKYHGKPCTCIANLGSPYGYKRNVMQQEMFGDPIDIEFEGHRVMSPNLPEKYLEQMYGDFMKFPPPEQRVGRHGIIKIQL